MARVEGDRIYLEGVVGSLDGDKNLRERITGDTADADALGTGLAEQMLEKGAAEILEEGRRTVENPANAVVR
jgi:hydroxymethylbilane synthase